MTEEEQDALVEELLRKDKNYARKEAARVKDELPRFYDYVRQAWPHIESAPFIDNWHIGAIAEHLQAVTEGQIKNLLINIPPGCSKSLITCVLWPTWVWGPKGKLDTRWFFSSYDQRLSTRDSVKCRALMESPWYRERWPVKFKDDANQKTYYETDKGGYRLATSVGGHGTGEHPDLKVVDDPSNVEKAESELERQGCIDWWDLTMATRGVTRGARSVIIMQRLKENDLAGHVLENAREDWEHICLPMRYEKGRMKPTSLGWTDPRTQEGELLSPKQFPEEVVAKLERSLGTYGTASQLQQRPAPREGGMFKSHWLPVVPVAPLEFERLVRAWDKAGTEGGGDWSVGVLMGKTKDGLYWVLDVVRGQWSIGERNKLMREMAEKDPEGTTVWIEQEPGSGGKESAEYTIKDLAGYTVKSERITGDKETRAGPFAAQAEAGNVRLVKGDWNKDYLSELLLFPYGKHDDQVDASSLGFNKLALRKPIQTAYIWNGAGAATLKEGRK